MKKLLALVLLSLSLTACATEGVDWSTANWSSMQSLTQQPQTASQAQSRDVTCRTEQFYNAYAPAGQQTQYRTVCN